MAYGQNPLQCPRCGQDRVVFYVKVKGPYAILKTVCPNDRSKKAIRFPLNTRDQWIRQLAENIYRCSICGQTLQGPAKVSRDGRWIVLYMECPTHGLRDSKRYIIDSIYPAIESFHNPMGAQRGPPTFGPPSPAYPPLPPPGAAYPPPPPNTAPLPPPPHTMAPPPPPPDAFTPPPSQNAVADLQFCPDCGGKITPGALFCTQCGSAIEEDYSKF